MAAPLQFKQRVRLPDEPWLPATRGRRRVPMALLGGALWIGLAALCYSIATGAVPVARWLGARRAPLAQRAAESQPRPLRARTVEPAVTDPDGTVGGVPLAPLDSGPTIEPAPPGSHAPTATPISRGASAGGDSPDSDSRGLDPFAASDGIGDGARDTGEATVEDAPSMATSSGIKHTSCEAALDASEDRAATAGAAGAREVLSRRIMAVIQDGRWFSGCGSVKRFEVHVCVAVQNGRPVGVTARTLPAHHDIVRCIANQAWALRFPVSPRLDVERASFAPD